jgi:hypothetical protein
VERANAAIKFAGLAPSLLEALIVGGLSSETEDERIDARAALQWVVYAAKRQEELLMKLCA